MTVEQLSVCRGEDDLEEAFAGYAGVVFEGAEDPPKHGPPTGTGDSPARASPLVQEELTPHNEEMLDPEPGTFPAYPAFSASLKTALRSGSRLKIKLAAFIARSITGSQSLATKLMRTFLSF